MHGLQPFAKERWAARKRRLRCVRECEARLVGVSALSLEYAWFVAAVRRALFGA